MTNFEDDKKVLKQYIERFFGTSQEREFKAHPYFDELSETRWEGLLRYPQNYHPSQFYVQLD